MPEQKTLRFLFEKLLEIIQKYSVIISVIAVFLGGIYQFIILSHLSIYYLTFFSISNLIVEGMMSFILLTLISFCFKISWDDLKKNKVYNVGDDFWKLSFYTILILVTPGAIILVIYFSISISWGLFTVIIFTLLCIMLNFYSLNKFNKLKADNLNGKVILYVMFYVISCTLMALMINKVNEGTFNSFFPNNLKRIKQVLEKKNPHKKIDLYYQNKDYLFFKIQDSTSKNIQDSASKSVGYEIEILETKELFSAKSDSIQTELNKVNAKNNSNGIPKSSNPPISNKNDGKSIQVNNR